MGIIVDNFAGGGGASTGIEAALGRAVDIAVDHSAEALAMHEANHPGTLHLCEDVFAVKPREVCGGRDVDLAWFSPDCRHFSKAKGGRPVSKQVRGLAWVAVRWAREVRPRVIILENVEEFQTWGPLDEGGRPVAAKRGLTFRRFVGCLRGAGYEVEWRELVAADYGAPTTRKRLFLVARCDGRGIAWPEASHRDPGATVEMWNAHLPPWRSVAECIDWSLPCPSIFERSKPLAEATLRRIAEGLRRFVIEVQEPFTVPVCHSERSGRPRCHSIREPLGTIMGHGKHALVTPFVTKFRNNGTGVRCEEPAPSVAAQGGHLGLVAAFLAKHYSGAVGHGLKRPLGTVTAVDHHSLVQAFLIKYYGTGGGPDMRSPAATITSRDRLGLVTIRGEDYRIVDIGLRMLSPRELARAQGFPDGYVLTGTKTSQVARIGNSVCPPVAEALVRANIGVPALMEATA